ncbi:MAG: 4-hydroxy-tetrahydrodipicolinate synthase [Caldisericia bacterium]|nr:4-hydroxy-tetrahydrodipicolinate synthase [Caldisericia bacterium]MDD4615173.1 4-hydroxy-tetrahydrodipicolinate synthase [Caldisericia bacterium]
MTLFNGVGTAVITPFLEDYSIDYSSFGRLLEQQRSSQMDACILLGTTGECPVISGEERKNLILFTKEHLKGEMPIILGTGSNNPSHVVALNKQAEELGVDGLLIVNPYYNKSTQKGLVEYYSYIAGETTLPIILYNVPSRTGMNVLPETIIELHQKAPSIVAVKEASSDISQINWLLSQKPPSLDVYSGNDDQTLPILSIGGKGVISVASNVIPSEMKSLTKAFFEGDLHTAQSINNRLLPFMKSLFLETNPSPVKFANSALGRCKNILRRPLIPIQKCTEDRIVIELQRLGYVCK